MGDIGQVYAQGFNVSKYSPLSEYKKIADKFGFTGDKLLSNDRRQAFVQEQIEQIKLISNRLITDATATTLLLAKAQDQATKSAYQGQLSKYENDLQQQSDSLDSFIMFKEELEAEG